MNTILDAIWVVVGVAYLIFGLWVLITDPLNVFERKKRKK